MAAAQQQQQEKPKISYQEVLNLVASAAPTDLIKPIKYLFRGNLITVYNGKFVNKYDKERIDLLTGQVKSYPSPKFVDDGTFLPGSFEGLIDILEKLQLKVYPQIFICKKIHTVKPNLAAIISFFSIYKMFGPTYKEYIENPDAAITTVPPAEYTPTGTTITGKLRRVDIRATAHLLMLLMATPVNELTTGYMERRLRAIRHILNDQEAKFLILPDHLAGMQNLWKDFRKLRSALINFLISIEAMSEIFNAFIILYEPSMIPMWCISQFLSADIPVAAHELQIISEETEKFLNYVVNKRPTIWIPYIILCPHNIKYVTKIAPNLVKAAIVYCKNFKKSYASCKEISDSEDHVAQGVVEAATTVINPDIMTEQGRRVMEISVKVRGRLTDFFDTIECYMPNKRHREVLEIGNETSNQIANIT